jgi:1-acyl-sn-glycerol-3-phosphate acyltransferase
VGERLSGLARIGATLPGWLGFAVLSALYGVLFIPVTLLLRRVWPGADAAFSELTRRCLTVYLRSLLFVRLIVEGREHSPRGAHVIVANHQSWLDPVVMISLEPRVAGPAKSAMFRVPVLGAFLRLSGFYDVRISSPQGLAHMNRGADVALARHGTLLFFPEGTRSQTGRMGRFRRGAFRNAVDHGLPIQPVVIEGMDRVLPPGHLIAQTRGRYPVRVRFLPAVYPPYGSGPRRAVVRDLCERVHDLIEAELARMRAERAGGDCGVEPGEPRRRAYR